MNMVTLGRIAWLWYKFLIIRGLLIFGIMIENRVSVKLITDLTIKFLQR